MVLVTVTMTESRAEQLCTPVFTRNSPWWESRMRVHTHDAPAGRVGRVARLRTRRARAMNRNGRNTHCMCVIAERRRVQRCVTSGDLKPL